MKSTLSERNVRYFVWANEVIRKLTDLKEIIIKCEVLTDQCRAEADRNQHERTQETL